MTYEQGILLTGDQWCELSEEKKLEALQAIENHFAFESGRLSCPVVGKFLYAGNDGVVLGTYDPKGQVIYVNASQFAADSKYGKDSEAMVTACLHEGRHAYQHQVSAGIVSHDNKAEAEAWRENLKDGNYISFQDNPRAYYYQPVEVDARRFAAEKYMEIVSERQQQSIEHESALSQRDVFEKQLNEGCKTETKEAAMYVQTKSNTDKLVIG